MAPGFVLAHIHNLPIASATAAEMRGGQRFRGWDEDRYLLASVSNALRALIYVTRMVNRDPKKPRLKVPDMWPIPDEIKQTDKPGSFGFIAKSYIAAAKRKRALTNASR